MTQENKDLLLKDLSSRLPYGVKIRLGDYDYRVCGYDSEKEMPVKIWYYYDSNRTLKSYIDVYLTDYRPYLRPMSSMTEEEEEKFENILEGIVDGIERWDKPDLCEEYDWLNAHHFDFRNLIGRGLALEAPEGMYK